jgi:hypothetical protein
MKSTVNGTQATTSPITVITRMNVTIPPSTIHSSRW